MAADSEAAMPEDFTVALDNGAARRYFHVDVLWRSADRDAAAIPGGDGLATSGAGDGSADGSGHCNISDKTVFGASKRFGCGGMYSYLCSGGRRIFRAPPIGKRLCPEELI